MWRQFESGEKWCARFRKVDFKYAMPPKAKGKKAAARKMPPPLPKGEILTDGIQKQQWVIGSSIGKGGFGEIYIATLKGQVLKNAEHVIKIVS